jgi:TonB family protein
LPRFRLNEPVSRFHLDFTTFSKAQWLLGRFQKKDEKDISIMVTRFFLKFFSGQMIFSVIFVSTLFPSTGFAQKPKRSIQRTTSAKLAPSQIAKRTLPSLVLVTEDCVNGGKFGSGVVVGPRTILTAKHVLQGRCDGQFSVRLEGSETSLKVARWFLHPTCDLAVLETDQTIPAPRLGLATRMPQLGESVYALGNPDGLLGSFSAGLVGGIRDGGASIQHTAVIAGGSSGGPLLDDQGLLVGINVSTLKANEGITFATSAPVIRELLDAVTKGTIGPQSPRPPKSTATIQPQPTQPIRSTLKQRKDLYSTETSIPGLIGPKILKPILPKYTPEARKNKTTGTVTIYVVVNEDGTVGEYEVTRPLPDGLTEEAIRCAKAFQFKPATKDGQPVKYLTKLDISFNTY